MDPEAHVELLVTHTYYFLAQVVNFLDCILGKVGKKQSMSEKLSMNTMTRCTAS